MLKARSVRRSALIDHLKTALTGEKYHFFADTSFLLASASLNPTARGELGRWIASLGERFHVPAWVGHEIYGKISSDYTIFAPMARVAVDAANAVQALQSEARRYIDTGRAREFWGRPDRVGFLADLDRAAQPVLAHAEKLRGAKLTADEAIEFLVELVNRSVLPSDIYSGLPELDANYAARVIGGHPPGYRDKGKAERTRQGDNRYGDLIIWREIVDFARATLDLAGVVLLTNDNKDDWVYVPATILDDEGRALNNDAKKGLKVILPLPLLCHELRGARKDADLAIVNLGMLSQLLHPELAVDAVNLLGAYQPAGTVATGDPEPKDGPPAAEEAETPAPEVEGRAPSLADLPDLLSALVGRDVEVAAAAAASMRQLIGSHTTADLVPRVADALVRASDRGIETATILIRDIVAEDLLIDRALRTEILGAMLTALYYDADGHLRNRPLAVPLPDLFGVQVLPALKPAVEALNVRLGPSRRFFLLTPDAAVPVVSLSVTTARDEDERQKLRGIYYETVPLLEDVEPGSERSLSRLLGGAMEATGADLRRVLSRYFRVPEAQMDLGRSRFEVIGWDELTGLVDWGVESGLQLR